jgi:hypothetical protein
MDIEHREYMGEKAQIPLDKSDSRLPHHSAARNL